MTVTFIAYFAIVTAVFVVIISIYYTQHVTQHCKAKIAQGEQAQEELRKLSRAVDQSGSSIVITDLKGNIEVINPAFTNTTGYTFDEVVGQNPRILQSGQQPLEMYRQMWDTILNGDVWQGEFLNKKKNGDLYWEAVTISPVKEDNGNITHYVAIKDNITVQKEAQEKLVQRERHLRQLTDNITDILVETELDGTIRYITSSWERIMGYSIDEMIGHSSYDM